MMKKLIAGLIVMPLAVLAATSTPKGFMDDLDAALASAKASGKFVYACFSGSDWCGWCVKLEKEVFSDEAFATSLKDDYELVFIDSPRDRSRLSEGAKVRNPELTRKFGHWQGTPGSNGGNLPCPLPVFAGQQGEEDFFLGLEVIVDGRAGEGGRRTNILDGNFLETTGAIELLARRNDFIAPVLSQSFALVASITLCFHVPSP